MKPTPEEWIDSHPALTTRDVSDQVTVVIPIFGDLALWRERAQWAVLSATNQTWRPAVVVQEGLNIADARNRALEDVTTEWVIYLDADDQLYPDYVEHMLQGEGDVRWPAVDRLIDGQLLKSVYPVDALERRNWIVIGAMVRREMVIRAGGFKDYPLYEDWDLWLRIKDLGAVFMPCLASTYRYTFRVNSRSVVSRMLHRTWYYRIINDRLVQRHTRRVNTA